MKYKGLKIFFLTLFSIISFIFSASYVVEEYYVYITLWLFITFTPSIIAIVIWIKVLILLLVTWEKRLGYIFMNIIYIFWGCFMLYVLTQIVELYVSEVYKTYLIGPPL